MKNQKNDHVHCPRCQNEISKSSKWYKWWAENNQSDTDRSIPMICIDCDEELESQQKQRG